jgi:N-acetylmuramoyl-L-alanine amidase
MKVKDHWMTGIQQQLVPKMGGTITPRFLVLHHTAGWTFAGDRATLTSLRTKVSCHILIGPDGETLQMGPFNRRMWHAGPSRYTEGNGQVWNDLNSHSIGIEITGIGFVRRIKPGEYRDQYGNTVEGRADGTYVNGVRRHPTPIQNWPHYRHKRLGPHDFAWWPYTQASMEALDRLIPPLLAAYPTLDTAVTHEEIDTRGWKTDVAPHFPMARYRDLRAFRPGRHAPDLGFQPVRPPAHAVRVSLTAPVKFRSVAEWSVKDEDVFRVLGPDDAIWDLGSTSPAGFLQVWYNGVTGWVPTSYVVATEMDGEE